MTLKRGMNLGGWFSHFYDPPSLWRGHFETFLLDEDLAALQQLGLDHVRLPLDWRLLQGQEGPLREALNRIFDHGLAVQLNLHHGPGTEFTPDNAEQPFFKEAKLRAQYLEILRDLVRIDARGTVYFEIFNEVFTPSYEQFNEIQQDFVRELREETDHPLIVTSNAYGSPQAYGRLESVSDRNCLYNFHFYGPLTFTHQGAQWVTWTDLTPQVEYPGTYPEQPPLLCGTQEGGVWNRARMREMLQPALQFRDTHQITLLCNEWGVIDTAPDPAAIRWVSDCRSLFEELGIAHTYWNYRSCSFGVDERVSVQEILGRE